MAKRAICDVCKAEGELGTAYAEIPQTWFTLRQRFTDEQHCCSLACLQRAVDSRREAAQVAAEPASAETVAA